MHCCLNLISLWIGYINRIFWMLVMYVDPFMQTADSFKRAMQMSDQTTPLQHTLIYCALLGIIIVIWRICFID